MQIKPNTCEKHAEVGGTGDVLTRTLSTATGFFLRPGGRGTQTSALPPKAFGAREQGSGRGRAIMHFWLVQLPRVILCAAEMDKRIH